MDGFQGYFLPYLVSLLLATAAACGLMFLSFVLDRIILQEHLKKDIKENARKVWGVSLLAVGAAIFLFLAFPSSVAVPAYIGLFVVAGVSGPFDLLLHGGWKVVQRLEKAAAQALEVEAGKRHAEKLETQIIGAAGGVE